LRRVNARIRGGLKSGDYLVGIQTYAGAIMGEVCQAEFSQTRDEVSVEHRTYA
jgi:hypothetical protein